MAPSRLPSDPEARHSAAWYSPSRWESPLRAGDRVFIPCEGGPCTSRLEVFPPRIEIAEKGGLYVLLDEGPPDGWLYHFVPNRYEEG
jgi:hypothetical protein